MIPYVVQMDTVLPEHLAELARCDAFLAAVPERPTVIEGVDAKPWHPESHWSCHVLARAFALSAAPGTWRVADGFYLRQGVEHSWLWQGRPGDRSVVVLDVLPVAGVRPSLVDGGRGSPLMPAYIQCDAAWAGGSTDRFDAEAALLLSAMGLAPAVARSRAGFPSDPEHARTIPGYVPESEG